MTEKPTHNHLDDEKAREIAQRFLLDALEEDDDDLIDAYESLSESEFQKSLLRNNIVIVCNECRRQISEIIREVRLNLHVENDSDLSRSAQDQIEKGANNYQSGKVALQQKGKLTRKGIERLLKKLSEKIDGLKEASGNAIFSLLMDSIEIYGPENVGLPTPTDLGVPEPDDSEERKIIALKNIPKNRAITDAVNNLNNQILVLRALLGEVLVIGDEEYLAEHRFAEEE